MTIVLQSLKHISAESYHQHVLTGSYIQSKKFDTICKYKEFLSCSNKMETLISKQRFKSDILGNVWFSKNELLDDPFDLNPHIKMHANPSIMAKWMVFFRNQPMNKRSNYHDIEDGKSMNDLIQKAIQMKRYDLLELLSEVKPNAKWILKFLKSYKCLIEEQIRSTGILSLTKSSESKYMWGRYSDGFSGYCITYAFDKSITGEFLKEVQYRSDFAPDISKILDTGGTFVDELVCLKDLDYEKEKEWRMLRQIIKEDVKGELLLAVDSPLVVKEITVGYKASKFHKKMAEIFCKTHSVPLLEWVPNMPKSIFERNPIHIPESLRFYYEDLL